MTSSPRPPDSVLDGFALPRHSARPLRGGRGRAWSAGNLVLKPVEDVVEAVWTAEVLSAVVDDGFRINRPVRSRSDGWVVDGWAAWDVLPGEHDSAGRWTEILHVGSRLNAALNGLARPAFMDARTHPWAVGDRLAWGEEPLTVVHEVLGPLADRLTAHLRPDDSPGQIIHGDLAGNVLFAPGLAPAVIDFTPYWRPPRFCLAVVAVDAVLWHGGPPELPAAVPGAADRTSLVARAALYRLIASDRLAGDMEPGIRGDYLRSTVVDHGRLLGLLDRGPA